MDGSQPQWNPDSSGGTAPAVVQPCRKMVRAKLLGAHTHRTRCGTAVHISRRKGAYIGRGWHNGQQFGKTLGRSADEAEGNLRDLLSSIEHGSFCRPSEERKRPLKNNAIPRLTMRELCREFLAAKRKECGKNTCEDYKARLLHALDFFETKDALRKWSLASDLNREAIVELRVWLVARQVTRNGRAGATSKPMSPNQIRNCLETLRNALAWAARADVRKLPPEFVNPVTKDLIGPKPSKDPLRKAAISLASRVEMVTRMDEWQLLHLWMALVLPLRFEDIAGLLISDVDLKDRTLAFGTRFGGNDFTKGRVTVKMPFPAEVTPLLKTVIADRPEGPLFYARDVYEGRRRLRKVVASRDELVDLFDESLATASPETIQTEQDRKYEFRRLLRQLGGVSSDRVSKELKGLLGELSHLRPYELRGSVTQEMREAGVRHLELRYLTGHTLADIINDYSGLQPHVEMEKYFQFARPLIDAICNRANQLGAD